MHLAHWILAEGHFSSGVTESELVRQCTQYLRQRRYEDDLRAEEVAREFVQFCRGRAWVLAEAGTSAVGERLYTFTHRTFLEYYAAFHLARTSGEPEQLASELAPRLARSEWDVVGQLALQMANKQRDLGADRFLNALLDSTFDEFGSEHLAILRFAADSLQYAVPSPSTVRRITAGCIAAALAVDQATGDEFFDPASAKPPLAFALGSLPHSRPVVASQLSRDISGLLADVDVPDRTAARAYAICSLPFVIAEPPESRSEEAYTFWQEWTARELGDRPWQDRFYADEGLAAMGALEVGRLSISDFLARHDARALYDGPRDAGLGVRRVGTLSLLTGWLSGFFAGYLFQVESVDRLLVELEPALRSRGLPLVGAPPAFGLLLSPEGARDRVHGVDGAALGGVVLLFCMDLEGPDPVPAIPGGQPGPHPAVRLAYALAAVRRRAASGEQVSIEDIDEESRRFFRLLDEDVRVLLLRWAEGQQSFWSLSVGGSPGIEDDPDHESRDAGPSEAPGSLLAIPEGSELDV